ncbi:kinase-like domain [Fusarium albosuccineum]|uniref:Kinase-like domain n=1 Tax=Fusarium albosuccineum TaxID=1237068 RepID=A0A8H4LGL9_9HYPO|nr:kinase-like domain [Fusarium albosuccineum]
MADNSSPDYKKLFLQEQERRKQAEEQQRQAEEQQRQERKRREQAEERQKQAEDEARQDRERNQPTTFAEFICHCHNLLSRSLTVETPSRSTTGKIPLPTGKFCPTRLRPWMDCLAQQQAVYDSVRSYLQPAEGPLARLFPPLNALEDLARRFALRPISSEQGIETYERIAVEDHVRDIVTELCKISEARDEFGLGDGVWFDNHTNALNVSDMDMDAVHSSDTRRPKSDQYCLHRVDGNTNTLLLTNEYKPPHKLSVENLRAGLRPMELWKELVQNDTIPTDPTEKLQYNAERLTNSAVVQVYDVMIKEGCAYSTLTNGLARVLLHVPHDDPATLYYHLCEPNREIDGEDEQSMQQQPRSSVARVLCLCLMSFRFPLRDQGWRNAAQSDLHIWKTSFDHTRSQIPGHELLQTPPQPGSSTSSRWTIPEPSSSEYQPSSSPPMDSPTVENHRVPTRSHASCGPSDVGYRMRSPDSPDPDPNGAAGRKRGFSQVALSSPSAQRAARQQKSGNGQDSQPQCRDAPFCTQQCLCGLQAGGILDERCPNVMLHRQGGSDTKHPITAEDLVTLLKAQLDDNIDGCLPLGGCGGYGAPFKLTCTLYGYTVVGKGTTSELWEEVSREAEVYKVLQKAQGSAVPVFLGTIDLAKIYFLHGAGQIRHMLVMGWGGESTASMELEPWLHQEIRRSNEEIRALGIYHEDFRRENILWNKELGRALIIDFHRLVSRQEVVDSFGDPSVGMLALHSKSTRDQQPRTRIIRTYVSSGIHLRLNGEVQKVQKHAFCISRDPKSLTEEAMNLEHGMDWVCVKAGDARARERDVGVDYPAREAA